MFQKRVIEAIAGRDKQYKQLLGERKSPHQNPYGAPFRPARDLEGVLSQLQYKVDLPTVYQSNFVELHADSATRQFIEESLRKYHRCWAINYGLSLLRTCLNACYSHTDVIGMLNVGLMHVMSARQMQKLLLHSLNASPLDVDQLRTIHTKMVPSSKLPPLFNIERSSHQPHIDPVHKTDGNSSRGNSNHRSDPPSINTSDRGTAATAATVGDAQQLQLGSHSIDINTYQTNFAFALENTTPSSSHSYAALTGQDMLPSIDLDSDTDDESDSGDDMGSDLDGEQRHQQGHHNAFRFGSLLDVGSGSGRIPKLFQPIMTSISCTESSKSMVKSLRNYGFTTYHTYDINSLPSDALFNNVTLFNLIDRCDEPITLLFDLHQRLVSYRQVYDEYHRANPQQDAQQSPSPPYVNPGGRVVIACPLPLRPAVEEGTKWRPPAQNIAPDGCFCCFTFEESLRHLILNVIDPCGFSVLSISRVPYLSEGNLHSPYFALDDVILVLTPKHVE